MAGAFLCAQLLRIHHLEHWPVCVQRSPYPLGRATGVRNIAFRFGLFGPVLFPSVACASVYELVQKKAIDLRRDSPTNAFNVSTKQLTPCRWPCWRPLILLGTYQARRVSRTLHLSPLY
jgi:hypothetical protein